MAGYCHTETSLTLSVAIRGLIQRGSWIKQRNVSINGWGTCMIVTILTAAAKAAGIPPLVLIALCTVESNLQPHAVNLLDGGSASHGLCQIKMPTARLMGFTGSTKALYNPENNAYYAAKYLAHQLNRYNGNMDKAIMAYNLGTAPKQGDTKYLIKVLKELLKVMRSK